MNVKDHLIPKEKVLEDMKNRHLKWEATLYYLEYYATDEEREKIIKDYKLHHRIKLIIMIAITISGFLICLWKISQW